VHVAESEHALPWARAWLAWEDCVATWTPPQVRSAQDDSEDAQRLLAKARIETHFARHRYFLGDNQLLRDAYRLPEVPITLVHGRRDLVCPMEGACALHRRLSGSRLVVPDAGHLATEPAMVDALVSETDRMRDLLG
jgi:proline iminopeptidase